MDVELIKQLKERVIRHRITSTTELQIEKNRKTKNIIFFPQTIQKIQ